MKPAAACLSQSKDAFTWSMEAMSRTCLQAAKLLRRLCASADLRPGTPEVQPASKLAWNTLGVHEMQHESKVDCEIDRRQGTINMSVDRFSTSLLIGSICPAEHVGIMIKLCMQYAQNPSITFILSLADCPCCYPSWACSCFTTMVGWACWRAPQPVAKVT